MNQFLRHLLFPPPAVAWGLLPLSLIWVLGILLGDTHRGPAAAAAYGLSAYGLTVFTARLILTLRQPRRPSASSRLARRRLSPSLALGLSSLWNLAYSLVQFHLWMSSASRWCLSLFLYYLILSLLRFLPAWELRRPQAIPAREYRRSRLCAWILLGMNLCLPFMVHTMILEDQIFLRHEILAIALAAFTFFSFTKAILSYLPAHRQSSPLMATVRGIDLIAASVSILSLESTLLTTFGDTSQMLSTRSLFLGLSGIAVTLAVWAESILLLRASKRALREQHWRSRP